jgi:hypothetical protein
MRVIVREAQRGADEMRVIDAEIDELENENRDLHQELPRLSGLLEVRSH